MFSSINLEFLQTVMNMPDEESGKKMEEIRKFSAIYGRFDAKRKPEKPLTLHEVRKSKKCGLKK